MHVVDDPPGYALEVVDEPGGRQGFQVAHAQLDGTFDHPVDGQLVIGRRCREAVGHGVKGEVAAAGDQAGEPGAAERRQQVRDPVLHVLAEGDPEPTEAQDCKDSPTADGFLALVGGRPPRASRGGHLSHGPIAGPTCRSCSSHPLRTPRPAV